MQPVDRFVVEECILDVLLFFNGWSVIFLIVLILSIPLVLFKKLRLEDITHLHDMVDTIASLYV